MFTICKICVVRMKLWVVMTVHLYRCGHLRKPDWTSKMNNVSQCQKKKNKHRSTKYTHKIKDFLHCDIRFRQDYGLFRVWSRPDSGLFLVWSRQDSGLFSVGLRQNSGLFRVQFRQDSSLFRVQFRHNSGLFRVWFRQDSVLFRVWFRQDSGLFRA